MKSRNISGVTISMWQDIRRPLDDSEIFPIIYRINYKGRKKYLSSGKYLSTQDWKEITKPRLKAKKYLAIRGELQEELELFVEVIKKIFEQKKKFSFELLEQMLGNEKSSSINSLFKNKIAELNESDQIGSAMTYGYAFNSFKKFTESKEIFPNEVNIRFLNKYQKWMHEKGMTGKGNSFSTIGIYMRHLRAILNIAKNNQMITEDEYPFGKDKYQIPTAQIQKNTLTIKQIKQVIDEPCIEGSPKQLNRDMWIFSYLGNGLNINDICRLKYSDIIDDEIIFFRKKTYLTSKKKMEIHIPIIPKIQEIIDQWGNKDKTGRIFPFLPMNCTAKEEKITSRKLTNAINQTMKRISKKLKLGTASTLIARHSFAQTLVKNNTDIAALGERMGHSNVQTTAVYFPKTTKEERRKQSNKLL